MPVLAQKPSISDVQNEIKTAADQQAAATKRTEQNRTAQTERAHADFISSTEDARVAAAIDAYKMEQRLLGIEQAIQRAEQQKLQDATEARTAHEETMKLLRQACVTLLVAGILGGVRIAWGVVMDGRRHRRELLERMVVDARSEATRHQILAAVAEGGDKSSRAIEQSNHLTQKIVDMREDLVTAVTSMKDKADRTREIRAEKTT